MKKWKRALLSAMAVCTLLLPSASAARFTQAADTLKEMGLFAGTNHGYELDRAPTRAEAATMLVRLLGKTAEAEQEWAASSGAFAFKDMDDFDWAQPYVHWLSRHQIAAGTSAGRFTPATPCTAQMYAAFLMRALGYYESEGDFAFDDAIAFARSHGVLNDVNYSADTFLRDHVVAASYTALAAAPKSGELNLLTRLVNDGAVDASAASMEQQKFSDYSSCAQIMRAAPGGVALQNVTSFSMEGELDLAAVSEIRVQGSSMSSKSSLTITLAGEKPFVQERSGFYMNGRWYTNADGVKTSRAMNRMPFSQTEPAPLLLIDTIRTSSSKYMLTYNALGLSYYQETLRQLLQSASGTAALKDVTLSALTAEVEITDGALSALSASVTASAEYNGKSIPITAQQSSKITASGKEVTVEAPSDLSSYTQVS